MKRSQINAIMQESIRFLEGMHFLLPPFAWWTPQQWRSKGPECRQIVRNQLGWDITDFGSGDFAHLGLFLFTIRNGALADAERGGKSYAEKVLIVRESQITPTHFHHHKMEDIINRGGGDLMVQLWNSDATEGLADTEVTVTMDGVEATVPPGGIVTLTPGDSITLPQRLYHRFWGRDGSGTILVGEVSRVNDDRTDNRFHMPAGRFPQIEEDAPPTHLLIGDYPNYYRYA